MTRTPKMALSFLKAKNKQKGFTLMELLVVIAIIGLISTIVFVAVSGTTERARIARGLQFSHSLQNALGSYAVGIWRFDEGTDTTAYDASGWGNDGTLGNGACTPGSGSCPSWATDTPSGRGYALSFDGVNDYVNAGSGASLDITGAITIETWVNANNLSTTTSPKTIVRKDSAYIFYFQNTFDGEPAGLQIYLYGTSDPRLGYPISNFQTGMWYHLVGTYDGITKKLFVNGVQVASESTTGNIATSTPNVFIGSQTGTSYYFKVS